MSTKIAKYCATLGLEGDVDSRSIREGYHRQVLKWHPARHRAGAISVELAERRVEEIQEAYEFLSELAERAERLGLSLAERADEAYEVAHTYRDRPFEPGFPDPAVQEVFVKSSYVVSVGYAPAARALYMKVVGRRGEGVRTYRFHDVPEELYRELVTSRSPGRFANDNLHDRFFTERL